MLIADGNRSSKTLVHLDWYIDLGDVSLRHYGEAHSHPTSKMRDTDSLHNRALVGTLTDTVMSHYRAQSINLSTNQLCKWIEEYQALLP